MKSFKQQMNLVKRTNRHLTNFKGVEWVDVHLRQLWTEDELVEGVESKDKINIEGSDSFVSFHPLPVVLLNMPSPDYGNNGKPDVG